MRLERELQCVPGFAVAESLDRFSEHIDMVWVHEALAATGTASVRRRRFPAEQVVWLVIGMGLLRNQSIERVVALLDLALPSRKGDSAARSSMAQARKRLGEEPVEYLFAVTAEKWAGDSAELHRYRGLTVYVADGTTLRVPDSPENWKAFGGQCGSGSRNGSAYPTVRMVALMVARSHLISAVRFGAYNTGETTLANELWRELPDDSLTLVDRGFLVADELTKLERSGHNRHWLTRAKKTTRLRTLKRLGPNDRLVEIQLSDQTRRLYPELPECWEARAIKYQRKGFRPSTLLTSLVDPAEYPVEEIIELYHERWEIELGYDEVKTHLLDREETIRSRSPAGVRQEIWGVVLAYNLVRLEMERAAAQAKVEPNRISFVNALALIRNAWLIWSTPPVAPGRIPEGLLDLRRDLKLLLLPPRRPDRVYPRAVKIKMSNYNRKPPMGRGRK